MPVHFELQPAPSELQHLADEYWEESSNRERQLEVEAYEAGACIRNSEYTLSNLEAIVRWKSECLVNYLIGNGSARIRAALEIAANPNVGASAAITALLQLHGIDLPMASAILAAIFPERYIELDFKDLEALGLPRQDIRFYEEYLEYCRKLAAGGSLKAQEEMPGPAPLHALDRALACWTRKRNEQVPA